MMLVWALWAALVPGQMLRTQYETYRAPDGAFGFSYPRGWVVMPRKDGVTELRVLGDPQVLLLVRGYAVPEGADPMHLALHAADGRLKELPGFKVQLRQRMMVGGLLGARVNGQYSHQGNLQYPRLVEEVFVVSGTEAFVIRFECFAVNAAQYATATLKLYDSFSVGLAPSAPAPAETENLEELLDLPPIP